MPGCKLLRITGQLFQPHPRAAPAYDAWVAARRAIDFADLPTDALLDIVGLQQLVAVKPTRGDVTVFVVAGFELLRLIILLDSRGEKPRQVAVRWIEDDRRLIGKLVDAELLSALSRTVASESGQALLQMAHCLSAAAAKRIWGKPKVGKAALSRTTGVRRSSFSRRPPAAATDSTILVSIIARLADDA